MTERALNEPVEIPAELDRWNWGAFLLNWIWGIGNSTFIALLCLIPIVGLVMMVILGVRGSRWAWENRAWRDVEHFRSVQRKWAIAGAIVWAVFLTLAAAMAVTLWLVLTNSEAYQMTMRAVRADPRVTEALGTTLVEPFWFEGTVNVQSGGTGDAAFSIPLTGEKGSGTVYSRAMRSGGQWQMRLLFVEVDGSQTPIVIVNEDNLQLPGGGTQL